MIDLISLFLLYLDMNKIPVNYSRNIKTLKMFSIILYTTPFLFVNNNSVEIKGIENIE